MRVLIDETKIRHESVNNWDSDVVLNTVETFSFKQEWRLETVEASHGKIIGFQEDLKLGIIFQGEWSLWWFNKMSLFTDEKKVNDAHLINVNDNESDY